MFKMDVSLEGLNDDFLLHILLFSSDKYKATFNKKIIFHTINFLKSTIRFERLLFDRWCYFMTTFLNFSSSSTVALKIWFRSIACSLPLPFKSPIPKQCFTGFASDLTISVWVLRDVLWNVLIFVVLSQIYL